RALRARAGSGGGDGLPAAGGLLDLPRAQAARADGDLLRAPVHQRPHVLDVRLEQALGDVVGMAHVLARHPHLAAHEALRHGDLLTETEPPGSGNAAGGRVAHSSRRLYPRSATM